MEKYNTISAERNKELRKRFNELLSASGVNMMYFHRDTIVDMLYNESAPRFYISAKIAERYVLNYKRGVFLSEDPITRRKITDLAETFDRICAENPHMKRKDVWNEVVWSPAKSFYLSKKRIKWIVYGWVK